jgi:chitosanase
MPTDAQKATAQAIVNIFETGRVLGDYGNVTLLKGDSGHLTYGRSQTTIATGNLFLLVNAYVAAPEAHYAGRLKPFLSRLQSIDLSLDHDEEFKNLLRQAGGDLVMHEVQDAFFDRIYWNPAMTYAGRAGISTALGCCTVYDSVVHGSWRLMRDRTNQQCGVPASLGEKEWIANYIAVRRQWLGGNPNSLLQKTVYRMNELGRLVADQRWDLNLPLVVRGITIDDAALGGAPVRASAQIVEERLLSLRTPMLRGDDVKEVQGALNTRGYALDADGVFGGATAAAVIDFQRKSGLVPDGIVGPGTRAALGL